MIRWALRASEHVDRNWRLRSKFVLSALARQSLVDKLQRTPPDSPMGKLLSEWPDTVGYLLWPYQCAGWDADTRIARIEAHLAVLEEFPALKLKPEDKLLLADLSSISPDACLMIDRARWLSREGHLTLSLFKGDFRAFTVSFSLSSPPDFEIFIDPDGDTHAYYELEVNTLGTAWDLMLIKPYRDAGPAVNGWDIDGLRARVDINGSINRPGDRDDGWTIELALPWKILKEAAPGQRRPAPGDRWRINFSRVEWQTEVRDGKYVKKTKPGTTDALPEDNWVWSPQGAINMHMPERWGYVQFTETAASPSASFVDDPNERIKWALRRLYYRQRNYRAANGTYATTLDALNLSDIRIESFDFKPTLNTTATTYEITTAAFDKTTLHITSDGRVWSTRNP